MSVPLAGLARRFSCLLYESLAVFSVLLIGFLMPQIVLYGFGMQAGGKLLLLHIFALLMVYFVWCWTHGGQTLPMKTWKVRLVDSSGQAIRPLQGIVRYCAAWPSLWLFGIGLLWPLVDRDRQFLHDRLAGTRIISITPPPAG